MSSVEDIEKAVEKLPDDQLARFRAWFAAFDATRFDRRLADDASAGLLDRLADEALDEHRRGESRVWSSPSLRGA
ncbi:hypothetical protein BJ122_10259 [Rhodopseudomonas faecalis]|uniref:Uncharacterized protein n=1 Tax=Rhodopseudomonas faecalis TaxID=99655 RepID=A0A318TJN3_9BRAD|nr:hypothetical protein [Rhodopseudomonas faecalis]PYF04834.1 hypothetical protein BJ122_10259 [Rhodopseudomonas faecalis]